MKWEPVNKSQNSSEAFDYHRAAAMLKHYEHTEIKGNAVFAFMILFFFVPHYVCWSHDVIYDVYMDAWSYLSRGLAD